MTNKEAMLETTKLLEINLDSIENFSDEAKEQIKAILELADFQDEKESYQAFLDVLKIWQDERERLFMQEIFEFIKSNADSEVKEGVFDNLDDVVKNNICGMYMYEIRSTENNVLANNLLAMCGA